MKRIYLPIRRLSLRKRLVNPGLSLGRPCEGAGIAGTRWVHGDGGEPSLAPVFKASAQPKPIPPEARIPVSTDFATISAFYQKYADGLLDKVYGRFATLSAGFHEGESGDSALERLTTPVLPRQPTPHLWPQLLLELAALAYTDDAAFYKALHLVVTMPRERLPVSASPELLMAMAETMDKITQTASDRNLTPHLKLTILILWSKVTGNEMLTTERKKLFKEVWRLHLDDDAFQLLTYLTIPFAKYFSGYIGRQINNRMARRQRGKTMPVEMVALLCHALAPTTNTLETEQAAGQLALATLHLLQNTELTHQDTAVMFGSLLVILERVGHRYLALRQRIPDILEAFLTKFHVVKLDSPNMVGQLSWMLMRSHQCYSPRLASYLDAQVSDWIESRSMGRLSSVLHYSHLSNFGLPSARTKTDVLAVLQDPKAVREKWWADMAWNWTRLMGSHDVDANRLILPPTDVLNNFSPALDNIRIYYFLVNSLSILRDEPYRVPANIVARVRNWVSSTSFQRESRASPRVETLGVLADDLGAMGYEWAKTGVLLPHTQCPTANLCFRDGKEVRGPALPSNRSFPLPLDNLKVGRDVIQL